MLAALILALGLAMDAVAAAAVRGMVAVRVRPVDVAVIAALTGGLQGGMAALGWLVGDGFGARFAQVDHWIAFAVLAGLGAKAILGAVRDREAPGPGPERADPFALRGVVVLAFATSIDALAAGVTLPLLPVAAPIALLVIGGVTAALVAIVVPVGHALAVPIGRALGERVGAKLEIVGGLALIGIGAKILIEHLIA